MLISSGKSQSQSESVSVHSPPGRSWSQHPTINPSLWLSLKALIRTASAKGAETLRLRSSWEHGTKGHISTQVETIIYYAMMDDDENANIIDICPFSVVVLFVCLTLRLLSKTKSEQTMHAYKYIYNMYSQFYYHIQVSSLPGQACAVWYL